LTFGGQVPHGAERKRRQANFVTSCWIETTAENNGLVKFTAGISDLCAILNTTVEILILLNHTE
jgi:hypothetical protein